MHIFSTMESERRKAPPAIAPKSPNQTVLYVPPIAPGRDYSTFSPPLYLHASAPAHYFDSIYFVV